MMASARAAMGSPSGTVMVSVDTQSAETTWPSWMVITPMLANLVPVEVTTAPLTVRLSPTRAAISSSVE